MPLLWDPTRGGLLLANSNALKFGAAASCCCAPGSGSEPTVETCGGCEWLETFDVEGHSFTNGSCANCQTVFHQRYEVTYQGTIALGGFTWDHWKSSDDVFGSPGFCSGDFDDREIHVILREAGDDCYCQLRLRAASKGVDSTIFSPFNSFELDADRTLQTDGDDENDPCEGRINMRTQSTFNSGLCTEASENFYLHPNGT